jgi:ring-1,2-phenylacetyl-CoA epoxidase subunit PaaC
VRLGDGTDESHNRMQQAINELWQYTGELFVMNDADNVAASTGVGVNLADILPLWTARIAEILQEATLSMPPAGSWMQQGGKEGRHTEHLGYILAEMQYMQRTYPGMEW